MNLTLVKELPHATRIELPKMTRHEVCNPSVVLRGQDLYVTYKGINYNLRKDGYRKKHYAGFIVPFSDSQNYYAIVEPSNMALKEKGFIEDRHIRGEKFALNGLQDIRLFHWKNSIYALCAALTRQPIDGQIVRIDSMLLCKLNNTILEPVALLPKRQRCEKNWMPWVKEEQLHFIYHQDPYEVLFYEDGKIIETLLPKTLDELKGGFGGTPVIPLGDNFIGIIHRKFITEKAVLKFAYTHRLVIYDHNFNVLDTSDEFTFEGQEIEFCSGLEMVGKDLILAYGIWDIKPILLKVDIDSLFELLGLSQWIPPESNSNFKEL